MLRNFIHIFFRAGAAGLIMVAILLLSPVFTLQTEAHPLNNGYSNLTMKGKAVSYDLFIPEADLLRFDPDKDGKLDELELDKMKGKMEKYLADSLHMTADGRPMKLELRALEQDDHEEVPGVLFHLVFTAEKDVVQFTLHYNLLFDDVDPNHLNFLMVEDGNDADQTVLEFNDRTFSYESARSHLLAALWQYFTLGIRHILTGYDHLLFLLSLILVAARIKDIVKIVTSFTVAHSITLFLTATGRIAVSPRWVEASIALTICYVALENPFIKKIGWRWILTFFFGLVHGMGFASALSETGLPQTNLFGTVLVFNLGVEVGQLAVVLAVLPVLLRFRPYSWYPKAMTAVSLAIFAVAFYWLLERLGVHFVT